VEAYFETLHEKTASTTLSETLTLPVVMKEYDDAF